MSAPVLTVGIPFFNSAATLADAVRSVFAQTFTDWELVLADDGSTDDSLRVARAVDDPRVRVCSDGVNRGLVYRLNEIVSLARGRYVARMDGDDLMHPTRLEKQVAYLEARPDVDVVDCGLYSVDEGLRPRGKRGLGPLVTDPASALENAVLIHPAVVARVEWARRHPYDPAYPRAEDVELWNRTRAVSRFGRVREPLLVYRERYAGGARAYLRSARTMRRIARRYGPAAVGLARTAAIVGKSYAKSLTFAALAAAGRQDALVARRNVPLADEESRAVTEMIERVRRTAVPGL